MSRKRIRGSLTILVMFALVPGVSHAYVDPGTGAMLVQALLAVIAIAFFYLRNPRTLLSDLAKWLKQLRSKRKDQ